MIIVIIKGDNDDSRVVNKPWDCVMLTHSLCEAPPGGRAQE